MAKRFDDHDKLQASRLRKHKSDISAEMDAVVDTLQKIQAQLAVMTEAHKEMQKSLDGLCEVGMAWNNFKGATNTFGYLFGRQTWGAWLIISAIIYAITHNFTWPSWFK